MLRWATSLSPQALLAARLTSLLCVVALGALITLRSELLADYRGSLRHGLKRPSESSTNIKKASYSFRQRSFVLLEGQQRIAKRDRRAVANKPVLEPKPEANAAFEYSGVGAAPLQPETRAVDTDAYVALCLAVKSGEALNCLDIVSVIQVEELRHWIKYHAMLGIGKVYVYDESPISVAGGLEDLTASGLVEYEQLSPPIGQLAIYAKCLESPRRERHQFMGFFDSDEYLVLRKAGDLPLLLKGFEGKYGGIGVNWRLFGSSGHVDKPEGPVTSSFWKCIPGSEPQSRHIKSIVNTPDVEGVGPDPHTFLYRRGAFAATTSGQEVEGALSEDFVESPLVLFHYVTKSRQEFAVKMLRGSGMGNHRGWDFFEEMDSKSTEDCTDLLDWPKRQGVV